MFAIALCLSTAASAQTDQKGSLPYCFEVYEYIYIDYFDGKPTWSSWSDMKMDSMTVMVEEQNKSQYPPRIVRYINDLVALYYFEPCDINKKGAHDMIAAHNKHFRDKLMLAPTTSYDPKDFRCEYINERASRCPFGRDWTDPNPYQGSVTSGTNTGNPEAQAEQ